MASLHLERRVAHPVSDGGEEPFALLEDHERLVATSQVGEERAQMAENGPFGMAVLCLPNQGERSFEIGARLGQTLLLVEERTAVHQVEPLEASISQAPMMLDGDVAA